ncbi:hypothetical protein [Roseovarius sp. Pro17]|uniref:hypothetical protein n=1 Tax=Roseovarius sp. Pro17 TaxID=3108175 RepID=UPI002D77A4C5|nr:hypothetical protein [Roseovarius sp. Pro17]
MTTAFVQALPVFRAADLTVVDGANLGDAMSFADELGLDDVYRLDQHARPARLTVQPGRGGALAVAQGSPVGATGHVVHLDTTLTLMTTNGATIELLILVEVDGAGDVEGVYAMPLAELTPRTEYTLIDIDRATARPRFAEVACVLRPLRWIGAATARALPDHTDRPLTETEVQQHLVARPDAAEVLHSASIG